MKDNATLTVVCLAFNHARHIAGSLDSMLRQDTDFDFIILVHDDASTDGTDHVIRRYAAAYPDIIKPVLQTENQYSRGVKILAHALSLVQSEYAALCEADDYWTDSSKLQRQMDWMRAHPGTSLCCHGTLMETPDGEPIRELRAREGDGDLTPEQVLVDHDSIHTSSLLFRTAFVRDLPRFCYLAPVGDRPLKMHLATCGTVHYLDAVMSAYRYGVSGSWTERMRKPVIALEHASKTLEYLDEFNKHTVGKYSHILPRLRAPFQRRLLTSEMDFLMAEGRYRELLDPRFSQLLGPRTRMAAKLLPVLPRFARPIAERSIRALPSLGTVERLSRAFLARLTLRPPLRSRHEKEPWPP